MKIEDTKDIEIIMEITEEFMDVVRKIIHLNKTKKVYQVFDVLSRSVGNFYGNFYEKMGLCCVGAGFNIEEYYDYLDKIKKSTLESLELVKKNINNFKSN